MNILVTNDDGVTAPGLLALANAMRSLGNVTVLAPDKNWSASGHVKTLDRPLRVREVKLADGSAAFASDGAPSDCVALALLGLVKEKIDFVVSGINPYANLGHDVTYSGTVTAVMEAVITGVPGIAFSLNSVPEDGTLYYDDAAQLAKRVMQNVIANSLPQGVLLNVNIPNIKAEDCTGFAITRQGLRVYRDKLDARLDPRGRPYYWIGGDIPTGVFEEDTDFGVLEKNKVSITPLQLDLTAYQAMDGLRKWTWEQHNV